MIQTLMPMAGAGTPFLHEDAYFPKALTEIHGHPLVEYAVASSTSAREQRFIFVISELESRRFHLDDVLRLIRPDCQIVESRGKTGGALCSAMLAVDQLDPDLPLLVCNGDQFLTQGVDAALDAFEKADLDVGIITFPATHPRWSFARLGEDGLVERTAEKRPISTHATVGVYYYRTASFFLRAGAQALLKNNAYDDQFYICPSINELILEGRRVGIHEIDAEDFRPLGTPDDVVRFRTLYSASPLKRQDLNAR